MNKHIIYLASGSSRRFGCNKLLHEFEGKPLYLYGLELLDRLVASHGELSLTVVSRYEEIRRTAEAMGHRAVDCPDSELGVSYSIRAGIEALGEIPPEDFLLFMVADQPYLKYETAERLLVAAVPGTLGASLSFKGQPGNPTVFSARLIPELMELQGDTGGRRVLKKHPCLFIEAHSQQELLDIDTK